MVATVAGAHKITGLFGVLATRPLWCEARDDDAMLAALGVHEIVGTRVQVLACLCVQDAWRLHSKRRLATQSSLGTPASPGRLGALVSPGRLEDYEGYEDCNVVEVEVVLSSLVEPKEEIAAASAHRRVSATHTAGDSPRLVARAADPPLAQPPEVPPAGEGPSSTPIVTSPPCTASIPTIPPRTAPEATGPTDSAEKEMTVNRPVAEVFAVVTAFEAYPKWVAGLKKVEILERDEASGIGRVVKFTAGAMGLSINYTLSYSIAPPGMLSWVSIEGGVKSIVGQYLLTPADGTGSSTRVQYRLDVEMGFKVPGPVKRTVTGLVIGAALPDLKRYLESGKGSAR
jgi:uncharacterized membrane protein